MHPPVRLAISGASGRMGAAIVSLLEGDTRFELVHAVVAAGSPDEGAPVDSKRFPGVTYASGWKNAPAIDVVIDFSSPAALSAVLDHCLAHGIALVTGTTGMDDALDARVEQATGQVALLQAANFSLGVTLLTRLLRAAAASLADWDLEIVESHHGLKQDAPSGTALALGHAAAAARHTTLKDSAVYTREGQTGIRANGSIGFAVVRGGDIVGEHTALLIGHGERIELSHRATDRTIFARGALQAAFWLRGKAPGRWQLDDVVAAG